MNKKLFIPFIVFTLLVLALFIQLQRNIQGEDPRALESVLIGKQMPVGTFYELFDNKVIGQQVFQKGKPILVNVWATWCPTCYAEHQYLNQLAEQGITIVGINYKDKTDKAIKWLENLKNPYQIVLKDEKGTFGLDLGVYGTPETFIVDGKGIVYYRHTGDVNEKVWTQRLKPIYDKLAEQQ